MYVNAYFQPYRGSSRSLHPLLFYFPVFLVISGFFFPKNLNIIQFIKNRGLKILVPFLFFYLVSYLLFYLGMTAFPEYMHTDAKGISDIFVQRQWFNGPIWYLLCLFWGKYLALYS